MRTKRDFLSEEYRRVVADFLAAELATGLTFARLAEQQIGSPNDCSRLKANAEQAVGTVRRFRNRLNDEARQQVDARLFELEGILSDLRIDEILQERSITAPE